RVRPRVERATGEFRAVGTRLEHTGSQPVLAPAVKSRLLSEWFEAVTASDRPERVARGHGGRSFCVGFHFYEVALSITARDRPVGIALAVYASEESPRSSVTLSLGR